MSMKKFSVAAALVLGVSAVFAQSVEIATWSGFRKGAASFTFDDGAPSHVTDAGPLFDKYGYKATFNLVVDWNPNWTGFQNMANNGHEIASHSNTHSQVMTGEEASSKQGIEAQISQKYGCITLAYPNCNVPDESAVLANYIAGRICNAWGMSNVMGKDGPNNWAQTPAIMTGSLGSNDFIGNMQTAVQNGGWVMFLTHGFVDKENGAATYSPTNISDMENALQWASQNDKDIWVAPFRNVAMYIKERNASTIELMDGGNPNTVSFKLTHGIKDAISQYDYPLTLRVKKSEDWNRIQVLQANAELEFTLSDDYIIFNAVPNAGLIEIQNLAVSSSSEQAESSSSQTLALPEVSKDFPYAVYASGGSVMVSGAQGMSVTVFNALGNKLRSTRALGCEQKVFSGPKGLYIVKVGGQTFKVRL